MNRFRNFVLLAGVCLFPATGTQAQSGRPTAVRFDAAASSLAGPAEPDSPGNSASHAASPQAVVPRLMKFSGALHDSSGKSLSGSIDVTFALYSTESGGDALWFETQSVLADELGRYTALLGAMHTDGLPVDLFTSGEVRWLGIRVGVEAEQQPRTLLVSVPYALKAGDAETLGGKPATAYMLADPQSNSPSTGPTISAAGTMDAGGSVKSRAKSRMPNAAPLTACAAITSDGSATASSVTKFTSACNIQNSAMTEVSGKVGIGTTSPTYALDVTGATNASIRLSGAGTHQILISGAAFGRLGQDAAGFFFSSDSTGGAVRFLTNDGALHEWMRITSAGNVGIGTTAPANRLEVSGNMKITGVGNALVFPDGTVQTTAGVGSGGGTITGVTAGTDLTGGGTAGGVTLNLDVTKVPRLAASNTFVGNQTITGNLAASGTISGIGSGLTGVPNSALSGSARVRGIVYLAGCDSCAPLGSSDAQTVFYVNAVGPMTITSVACFTDGGSPKINVARHNAGPTNLLTSDLTCDGTATTSFTSSALALNDQLDFVMATPDGVAKRITVVIQTSLN